MQPTRTGWKRNFDRNDWRKGIVRRVRSKLSTKVHCNQSHETSIVTRYGKVAKENKKENVIS